MKMCFCMECGSELNELGSCTNADCVNYKEVVKEDHSNSFGNKNSEEEKDNNESKSSLKEKIAFFKDSAEKEKGKLIVPECVDADENEVHIKQYDIARLQSLCKGAFAEGRLQITNKRVLFRANGISISGPTTMQTEFSIEEIGGIEIRKEPKFNFITSIGLILFYVIMYFTFKDAATGLYRNGLIGTIASAVLGIGSIVAFFALREKRLPRYLITAVIFSIMPLGVYNANFIQQLMNTVVALLLVVSFLYNALARNLVVRVMTKGASPATEIRCKDGWFSFQHNEYTGFSQVIPGPDVDLAIKELGSLVRAVQHGQLS